MKNQDVELIEEIHTYLTQWVDQEGYSDVNLMLDKGLTDLAAYTLLHAGAINSDMCYDYAVPIEKAIETLVENYTDDQKEVDYEEFWVDTRCWIDDSNEHYFINSAIHFVDDDELREWGFKPSDELSA